MTTTSNEASRPHCKATLACPMCVRCVRCASSGAWHVTPTPTCMDRRLTDSARGDGMIDGIRPDNALICKSRDPPAASANSQNTAAARSNPDINEAWRPSETKPVASERARPSTAPHTSSAQGQATQSGASKSGRRSGDGRLDDPPAIVLDACGGLQQRTLAGITIIRTLGLRAPSN